MVFKDRTELAIFDLPEDRDYVTRDELVQVLTEHPCGTVYVEKENTLLGIITSGRIARKYDPDKQQVKFNRQFTAVYPEEYMKVRQIFSNRNAVNELPVVTKDRRLMGEYVRWDDALGMDYVELLLKDPYVLQRISAYADGVVLVEPCARAKWMLFSWWRGQFKKNKIPLQTIRQNQIEEHLQSTQAFLFVDQDELLRYKAVDRYLQQKQESPDVFYTADGYLRHIRTDTASDILTFVLKSLQNQGVSILIFDFEENQNGFLAGLEGRIQAHRRQFDATKEGWLPEEMKPAFAEELYSDQYKVQAFPLPIHFRNVGGIACPDLAENPFFHVKNGERLTIDQPVEYDRRIYVVGPCEILGSYVSDEYTIPSLIQKQLNQNHFSSRVINRGAFDIDLLACLLTESFQPGDVLILDKFGMQLQDFPCLNLTDALEKRDAPVSWFVDQIRHCNHKANQLFAHEIYQKLSLILRQPMSERDVPTGERSFMDQLYLARYFSNFDPSKYQRIGSIVMNCNPFTYGHRYLIDEARKQTDFLIIFVVEEDASFCSFQERFAMVCQGTADCPDVMVVPSGPYILSKTTFPEYFVKETDEDLIQNTEDDITLFSEQIAPRLGIVCRFIGDEREDPVTDAYNTAMKRILPAYGIQAIEIPRKSDGEKVISASRVRKCLELNDWAQLDKLVPASTKRILALAHEVCKIDFLPIREALFALYDREEMRLCGSFDLNAYTNRGEKTFQSVLIADCWDGGEILNVLYQKTWNHAYIVLNESAEKFMSFFKLPGFSALLPEETTIFADREEMRFYFEKNPDVYLPHTIYAPDRESYEAILEKLHQKRIQTQPHGGNVFLSVCIPSYNRGKLALAAVLRNLELKYDAEIEILVSNNGSTMEQEEYAAIRDIHDSRVHYYELDHNTGFSGNICNCLKNAVGHFAIIYSDEDSLIKENLDEALDYLHNAPDLGGFFVNVICDPETGRLTRENRKFGPGIYPKGVEAAIFSLYTGPMSSCGFHTGQIRTHDILKRFEHLEQDRYCLETIFPNCTIHQLLAPYADMAHTGLVLSMAGKPSDEEQLGLLERGEKPFFSWQIPENEIMLEESRLQIAEDLLPFEDYKKFFLRCASYCLGGIASSIRDCGERLTSKYTWTGIHRMNYKKCLEIMRISKWGIDAFDEAFIHDLDEVFLDWMDCRRIRSAYSEAENLKTTLRAQIARYNWEHGVPFPELGFEEIDEKLDEVIGELL